MSQQPCPIPQAEGKSGSFGLGSCSLMADGTFHAGLAQNLCLGATSGPGSWQASPPEMLVRSSEPCGEQCVVGAELGCRRERGMDSNRWWSLCATDGRRRSSVDTEFGKGRKPQEDAMEVGLTQPRHRSKRNLAICCQIFAASLLCLFSWVAFVRCRRMM